MVKMENRYSVSPKPEEREGKGNFCRRMNGEPKNAVEVKRVRFRN